MQQVQSQINQERSFTKNRRQLGGMRGRRREEDMEIVGRMDTGREGGMGGWRNGWREMLDNFIRRGGRRAIEDFMKHIVQSHSSEIALSCPSLPPFLLSSLPPSLFPFFLSLLLPLLSFAHNDRHDHLRHCLPRKRPPHKKKEMEEE